MKKRLITLLAAIVVLAILICLYMFYDNSQVEPQEDSAEGESGNSSVNITAVENVSELRIKNNNAQYTIKISGDASQMVGYENNSFDEFDMSYAAQRLASLSGEAIEEGSNDLSKFGLSAPQATAEIIGDTTVTLNLGSLTPDGKYLYVNLSGSNNVYMVSKGDGDIALRDLKYYIEKSITSLAATNVNYINIKHKDKPEILITNNSDNEALQNYVSTSGLSAFVMTSPIENAIVYPTNMQDSLLCNLSSMSAEVVDLKPQDLSVYGLNDPVMTVELRDDSKSFNLKMGNDAHSNSVYVMFDNKPEVYVMTKDNLSPFIDVNVMDFVQNFVSLYQRSVVDTVSINVNGSSHSVEFKSEGENTITTDDENVKRDNRNTYIDGVLIPKDDFGDFYEALVGIGFDSVDYSGLKPQESAAAVISYKFTDGSEDIVEYYNYNDNFYYIPEDTTGSALIVNKQQINQLLNKIDSLVALNNSN